MNSNLTEYRVTCSPSSHSLVLFFSLNIFILVSTYLLVTLSLPLFPPYLALSPLYFISVPPSLTWSIPQKQPLTNSLCPPLSLSTLQLSLYLHPFIHFYLSLPPYLSLSHYLPPRIISLSLHPPLFLSLSFSPPIITHSHNISLIPLSHHPL